MNQVKSIGTKISPMACPDSLGEESTTTDAGDYRRSFIKKPGLSVEINEKAIREHLIEGAGYFEPTPGWNKIRSWNRTWN